MFYLINNIRNSVLAILLAAATLSAQTYSWKSVQIKGGGLVTGLIYSKAQADLLYARTDIGGAYRWNAVNKTWIPITDGMTATDDFGIWSLAADPTNASKVYMATGLYSASWGNFGSVYGSNDKGNTWTKLATLPFKLGGNEPGRGICERLMVDPNKPDILFLGSKQDGLYKSSNSGVTWTKVNSLPASYITFVEFDKSAGTSGTATTTIYVGVADYIYNGGNVGVYRSIDGGGTWTKLANHPTALVPKSFAPGNTALTPVPTKMGISTGNSIYFTFCNSVSPNGVYTLAAPHNTISNGAVYKYNKSTNAWTNITPSGSADLQGGFSTIEVSPTDPNKLIISSVERWWPADELYFSSDGGANWASTFNSYAYADTWGKSLNKGSYSSAKAPYSSSLTPHWTTTVAMNPIRNNEVMIGTGFGVFANYDVSGLFTNANSANTTVTSWIFENDGLEETAPLELISPPSGAPLVSAIGDFDGFVHANLDASPATGRHKTSNVYVGTTYSISFAEGVPAKMVKAHSSDAHIKGSFSTDGGTSWAFFPTQPGGTTTNSTGGQIAVSANGNTIVWAPQTGQIAYSTNNGSSWTNSTGGVPNGLKPVADRVNSSKFYAYDPQNQKFYYSTNGGSGFSNTTLSSPSIPDYNVWQTQIVAVFGKEGHLWMAAREGGLYRSVNGTSFSKISTVTDAFKVTVGKASPTGTYPAVFIWGIVNGVNGLFRSDDEGATWERINDAAHEFARSHACMTGDPRVYGRLYLGTAGRGIVYGDRSSVTGLLDVHEISNTVSSYPNPFTHTVSIKCQGAFRYSLFHLNGTSLESGNASEIVTIGENYPKGVYIVKVQQEETTKIIRVVKE